ncbi:hypothetical protein ACWGE1_35365 [Streptomyces sp. NPDC054932]
MTEGLTILRGLEQLGVQSATYSQMASMGKDVLPEHETGLLVGPRQ